MPGPERWRHSVRTRYGAGCRRDACHRANRGCALTRGRVSVCGHWNRLVNVAPVRVHLRKLQRQRLPAAYFQWTSNANRSTAPRSERPQTLEHRHHRHDARRNRAPADVLE